MYHPKTLDLQARLGILRYEACGILECLWQWTSQYCPAGDIGRFPDRMIAQGVEWPPDDAERLITAMREAGWIDAHAVRRLIVHDWPEHCNDSVHLYLARRGMTFADDSVPKMTRLSQAERRRVAKTYATQDTHAHKMRIESAQNAHEKRTKSARMRTTNTNTNTNTNAYTNTDTNTKARGGEFERGRAPESVGDVALRCIGDLNPVQEHEPDDTLGYHRALISEATGGAFSWRGGHLMRLEGILAHTRGPALIRERIVDALSNSESEAIRDPAAFANSALVELARELGVTI